VARFVLKDGAEQPMHLVLLLAGCQHQYLAIPGATPMATDEVGLDTTDVTIPTYTVSAGDFPDQLDESVTLDIPIDGTWSFEVTEIVFGVWITETLSYAEYWVYEIQEEERTAGVVQLVIMLVSKPPSAQTCSRWHVGTKVCYGRVDEGIAWTSFFLADDGGTSSYGAEVPITLAPLTEVEDTGIVGECPETFDSCCATVNGMKPLECYVDPACACPSGTTDIGLHPNGYEACDCPD
jgi:hypothetical protein